MRSPMPAPGGAKCGRLAAAFVAAALACAVATAEGGPGTPVTVGRLTLPLPGRWKTQQDESGTYATPASRLDSVVVVLRAAGRDGLTLSTLAEQLLLRFERGRRRHGARWPMPQDGVTRTGVPYAVQATACGSRRGDLQYQTVWVFDLREGFQAVGLFCSTPVATADMTRVLEEAVEGLRLTAPATAPLRR